MPGNSFTASDKAVKTKLKPQQPEAQQMAMHQNTSYWTTILLHFSLCTELFTYRFEVVCIFNCATEWIIWCVDICTAIKRRTRVSAGLKILFDKRIMTKIHISPARILTSAINSAVCHHSPSALKTGSKSCLT